MKVVTDPPPQNQQGQLGMLNQAQTVPYALCRVQSISWAGGLSPGKQSGPFVCLSLLGGVSPHGSQTRRGRGGGGLSLLWGCLVRAALFHGAWWSLTVH